MNTSPDLTRKQRRMLAAVYGAALLYFVLKQIYYIACVGGFPDQTAHYSYLIYAARHPFQLPDFRAMEMCRILGQENGMTLFAPIAGVPDYLGHPPLYYWLMALVSGVQLNPDGSAAVSTLRVQLINLALTSGTLAGAFALGYSRLKQRPPYVHAVYAFAMATLPMLAYVGCSLNNDNLSFPAMVLFFWGLVRYQEERLDGKTYLLLGIGFLLGSFAKLTTALLFLIMLAVCLVMDILRTHSLRLILNRYFAATLPCYLLFLVYELYIHREYDAWIPGLSTVAPEYFRTTVFYVPPEERIPITFLQYLRRFAGGMGYTWSSLYGHNQTVNGIMDNGLWGLVYWIPVACLMITAIRSLLRREGDRLSLPVALAFLGTMAYHLYSNWSGHFVSGYLGGIQARYYLTMIVPMAFLMAGRFLPLFRKQEKVLRILAVLLILAWLAGDAPRLLFLYGFPATA